MPTALHTCPVPGCPVRLPRGVSRCPAHARQQERYRRERIPGRLVPGKRGHLIDYYQTREWQALRREVLRDEPFCWYCQHVNRRRVSTVVDHTIPRSRGGTDTRDNLHGVCESCHSTKTVTEQRQSA